ncbi:MAG: MopE-related protein [Archangium sp.]|nr:MopE-related protein [Archangium sp.]
MLRRLLVVLALTSMACGRVAAQGGNEVPDAAMLITACVSGAECALGEHCEMGTCIEGTELMDAGFVCTMDSDCPPPQRCLRSKGECVAPMDPPDAGSIDAGAAPDCVPNEEATCGVSKLGECRLGVSRCEADSAGLFAFSGCVGAVTPVAEVCDGLDNDCDGVADEALPDVSCGVGACARTISSCQEGLSVTCTPGTPVAELCNGLDDDCDGTTDEDQLQLTCGQGACVRSLNSCAAGMSQMCVPGPVTAEQCNSVDDDCNGTADDGLPTLTCGVGACARSIASCINGAPQTCTAGSPSPELCDGLDNDCNGQVDEGLGTLSCGMGACARSVTACVNGMSQTCSPGTPSAERCDGLDNDCNGGIDDGLGLSSCGVGACARTAPVCDQGQPRSCVAGTPGVEVCDAVDNDCDGQVDEGLMDATCGLGTCARTVASCLSGVPQTCVQGTPRTETCDGVDDDCDGQVDEGCSCLNGATRTCYLGPTGTQNVGACRGGTQLCTTGAWGACDGQVVPVTEACNGVDDDCDNAVDESLGTSSCGTGACARSTPACIGGVSQTCMQGMPSSEVCNGVDDDCDGQIDETLGSIACGTGACARSVTACVSGIPQTCVAGTPSTEVCDGADNDCDGATDELLAPLSCGQGVCARTVAACVNGTAQSCVPGTGSTEVCNGLDDDCDGTPDDGFGMISCGQGPCLRTAQACVSGAPGTCTPGMATAETCNSIDDDCDGTVDDGTCAPGSTCPGNRQVTPNSTVTLNTNATSPVGRAITCAWSVVSRPATSSGTFSAQTNCTASNYVADVVGMHVLRFTVTDSMGLTSSCETTVEVLPTGDLWVELTWNVSNDMDLHLLHPNAGNQRQANSWNHALYDCNYINKTPSWDLAGVADDPSLDRDVVSGTGPENTRINVASTSHVYWVGVHMYSWAASPTPVVATIRIYCAGQLRQTVSRSFSTPKDMWVVGSVNFANPGTQGCVFTPENRVVNVP